jgi:hypothetical protein
MNHLIFILFMLKFLFLDKNIMENNTLVGEKHQNIISMA